VLLTTLYGRFRREHDQVTHNKDETICKLNPQTVHVCVYVRETEKTIHCQRFVNIIGVCIVVCVCLVQSQMVTTICFSSSSNVYFFSFNIIIIILY